MVNSNLNFLIQFYDQHLLELIEAVKEIWSSEERVRCNPTGRHQLKMEDANLSIEFRINTKEIMKFTCRERIFFWKIIRLMTHFSEEPILRYIRYDLESHKRFFENSEEYFYLSRLSEEQFDFNLDTEIMYHSNRFYGQWFQLYQKTEETISIATVILRYFIPKPIFIKKQQPRKIERHRGYRDHGSLGSEFSQTAKQQSTDWSIKKEEEEKVRRKQDLLLFLLGADGWI